MYEYKVANSNTFIVPNSKVAPLLHVEQVFPHRRGVQMDVWNYEFDLFPNKFIKIFTWETIHELYQIYKRSGYR